MHVPPLWVRLAIGAVILVALALSDLLRHGRAATRWREYAFLAACVLVAVMYGVVNDQITCRISWEYFYFGKDLESRLGPATPPQALALSLEAARIGAEATWSAGLIAGAIILIANNPSARLPQLRYRQLSARLLPMIAITLLAAVVCGAAGYMGWLNCLSEDFRELAASNLWRPQRFMTSYGVHLGGYAGGLIAAIWAVISIHRQRRGNDPRQNGHPQNEADGRQ